MNILIAGYGKIGKALVAQLAEEGYDLTLIDEDPAALSSGMDKYDVMTVNGNCASMDTLKSAGVRKAELLIACTGNDEVNLLTCMTAHYLNPRLHTISRISDPEYTDQAFRMRDSFALSMLFNPQKEAAVEIAKLLRYPGFLKRESFAGGKAEIVEFRIDGESRLNGTALSDLSGIIKCHVLVCTVLRDGSAIIPDGTFVLAEGDRVFVTAPSDELAVLLKNLGVVTKKVRNVMIAGGGKLTYYLAQQLKNSSMELRIIEKDPDQCRELAGCFPRANVICGDASNFSLLEKEGVKECDALVSLTGTDELNMILSTWGSSKNVPVIVTKLARLVDQSDLTDDLPLGSVVSPRTLCCNEIVRYVRAMRKQTGAAVAVHSIAEGQVEALEFYLDGKAPHCGIPLKKLKLKPNIRLICISHEEGTEIPNGDSCFSEGDTVIVLASGDEVILQFKDIFA